MITRIFKITSGASYRHSGASIRTKAEMNTQWGCPALEVRGGAGHGGLKFINGFIKGFLCGLTCRRDAAAQAKPLSAPHIPVSLWS